MKTRYLAGLILSVFIVIGACSEFPMDEDDLLITPQTRCYIGSFYLYGPDNIDCLIQDSTVIDTVNQTIDGLAVFGTNLKKVKPAASLSLDSKITPDMGVWTDFTEPRKYTVYSGNREIQKEYTITIRLEGE